MRIFLALLASLTLPAAALSQTVVALHGLRNAEAGSGSTTVAARGPGPKNDWAGAQIAYSFFGNTVFEDNVQVAGQVALQYWGPPGGFHGPGTSRLEIPFVGNIARPDAEATNDQVKQKAKELATSAEGIHFGMVPNLFWRFARTGYGAATWMYVGFRTNAMKDTTDNNIFLSQFRLALGGELLIGDFRNGTKSGSVGVEFIGLFFSGAKYGSVFGTERSHLFTAELTGIVPLGDSFGVLLQGIQSIDNGKSSLRAGLVLNPPERTQ